jgi:hypothetical protein
VRTKGEGLAGRYKTVKILLVSPRDSGSPDSGKSSHRKEALDDVSFPGLDLIAIRDRIGDEVAFMECLGDPTEFCINLTEFPDEEMFRLKEAMDSNEDVI